MPVTPPRGTTVSKPTSLNERIMGCMTVDDPGDVLLPIPPSPPRQWCQDLYWHRRMFGQTRYVWNAETVTNLALHELGGRGEWRTPRDLVTIFLAGGNMLDRADLAFGHIWWRLVRASSALDPTDMLRARELLELSYPYDKSYCYFAAAHGIRPDTPDQLDAADVTRPGAWPWQQPLTEIWEIHHRADLLAAAQDMIWDLHADLALELAPRLGWEALAVAHADILGTAQYTAHQLEDGCALQRENRGAPGDPRRIPKRRFGALPEPRYADVN